MKTLISVLVTSFFCVAQYSNAMEDELSIPSLTSLRTMNGINPASYDKFWEKWQLVTTRYRTDNGEIRYIYANDIAYKAMKEGLLIFPDGSALGKVAFLSEADGQFPNSFEATNFTRLQIMVKDSEKFAAMNGWSYWLHVDGVKSSSAEDSDNAMACHACHTLVKDRDYIFAGPTFLGEVGGWLGRIGDKFSERFKARQVNDLSEFEKSVVALLPDEKPSEVHAMQMRLFTGSLHESIAPLAKFTESKSYYLLTDPVEKRFIVAKQLKPTKKCKKRALVLMDKRKVKKVEGKKTRQKMVIHGIVCNGKYKMVKETSAPRELI
jgi:hypothetical protein